MLIGFTVFKGPSFWHGCAIKTILFLLMHLCFYMVVKHQHSHLFGDKCHKHETGWISIVSVLRSWLTNPNRSPVAAEIPDMNNAKVCHSQIVGEKNLHQIWLRTTLSMAYLPCSTDSPDFVHEQVCLLHILWTWKFSKQHCFEATPPKFSDGTCRITHLKRKKTSSKPPCLASSYSFSGGLRSQHFRHDSPIGWPTKVPLKPRALLMPNGLARRPGFDIRDGHAAVLGIWVVVIYIIIFYFYHYLGKSSNLTSMFCKWVETTN